MRDYIRVAFPDFDSPQNSLAIAQYCLNEIVRDRSFDMLDHLMDESNDVGTICGDPGWVIDARKDRRWADEECAHWPAWAKYRAAMDEEGFGLPVQEAFLTKDQLVELLRQIVAVYTSAHPNLLEHIPDLIRKQL